MKKFSLSHSSLSLRSAATALAIVFATAGSGCYYRGGGLFPALAFTAIATAAIVSAERPPRPYVVYAPPPHRGYTWQPGYWTREDGEWEWVEGRWIRNYPGYRWHATHWVEDPGGRWRLIPGHWVAVGAPPSSMPAPGPDDDEEIAPPGEPETPAPATPAKPVDPDPSPPPK